MQLLLKSSFQRVFEKLKTSFSDLQIVSSVEIPLCNSSSRIVHFNYVNFVVVVVCIEPCLA